MIPFRLRKDARQWFGSVEAELGKTRYFDMFYFCLAVGLTRGKKSDVTDRESDELVDYYPGEYLHQRNTMTAWLISAELRAMGISMEERSAMHQHIRNLVDNSSPSFLNANGVKEMNRYASGGFDLLFDELVDPPRSLPS